MLVFPAGFSNELTSMLAFPAGQDLHKLLQQANTDISFFNRLESMNFSRGHVNHNFSVFIHIFFVIVLATDLTKVVN